MSRDFTTPADWRERLRTDEGREGMGELVGDQADAVGKVNVADEAEQLKAAIRWAREVGVIDDAGLRALERLVGSKLLVPEAALILKVLEEKE